MMPVNTRPRRSRAAAAAAATLAVLLANGCGKQEPVQAKQDTAPVTVKTAPVSSREIQRVVESVGTLFPFDETVVSAEIAGRVIEVRADLGDRVAKGQPLIRVSQEEQQYLVQQNEAQLRMTLERLGLKNERDRVKDVSETPDVRRAQADLLDAEQRFKRVRSLVDQGIGSQQELDQAQARLKVTQAEYDSAVNQVRNLVQEAERSRAVLDLQRKKLRDTTVYAPFDGAVKDRQVATGTYVQPNSPLLTLVKVNPIRLRLEIPERMAPWIRNGQTADVMMEAFGDRRFVGKIWRISPTVDQSKRTFIVEALIENPAGELKPGSYAKARLATTKRETVLVVPIKAVNYVLGANRAYVVRNDVIDAREVKLGDRYETEVEILEGVKEGEVVATNQLNRLDTGVKVRVAGGEAVSERRNSD